MGSKSFLQKAEIWELLKPLLRSLIRERELKIDILWCSAHPTNTHRLAHAHSHMRISPNCKWHKEIMTHSLLLWARKGRFTALGRYRRWMWLCIAAMLITVFFTSLTFLKKDSFLIPIQLLFFHFFFWSLNLLIPAPSNQRRFKMYKRDPAKSKVFINALITI